MKGKEGGIEEENLFHKIMQSEKIKIYIIMLTDVSFHLFLLQEHSFSLLVVLMVESHIYSKFINY